MRRREFISLLGSAGAWPLAARAQGTPTRRIAVLMAEAQNDVQSQARLAAFEQALAKLGLMIGRTIQVDYRWAAGDVARTRAASAELVQLAPDAIVAVASPNAAALQQATRTIPLRGLNILAGSA
jgi:putative ABC transport system substrate-binding protein